MGSAPSSTPKVAHGDEVTDGKVMSADTEMGPNIPASDNSYTKHRRDTLSAEREAILSIDYAEYEYPFENLVFEGGGAKGAVYIGCMEIMDDIGVKPKRVAGASAGAICATLVALGYNPKQMYELFQQDMTSILLDAPYGVCGMLPNIIRHFGCHPAVGFYDWLGHAIAHQMDGNADATFMQVFKEHKIELCVTAVNVNMLSVEYFHPKTSPDMKVRDAVRMSVAIPGVFQPVRYKKNEHVEEDLFVDGGTLCNYPLHAFDGWWLSMKPEDSFLNKIKSLDNINQLMEQKERFGGFNEKTVGFLVYSGDEQEIMLMELNSRVGLEVAKRPENSVLYKQWLEKNAKKKSIVNDHDSFIEAFDAFMEILRPLNREQDDGQGVIDKDELVEAIKIALTNDPQVPKDQAESSAYTSDDSTEASPAHSVPAEPAAYDGNGALSNLVSYTAPTAEETAGGVVGGVAGFGYGMLKLIFGGDVDPEKIFDELDADDNGKITFIEITNYIERRGIDMQSQFQGFHRKELPTVGMFLGGIVECFTSHAKKIYIQDGDVERSVGINTDYVGTLDFGLTDDDRDFCVEQGRRATIAFLRHYVNKNKATMKKKNVVTMQPLSDSQPAAPLTSKLYSLKPLVAGPLPPRPPNGVLPEIRGRAKPVTSAGQVSVHSTTDQPLHKHSGSPYTPIDDDESESDTVTER